MPPRRRRHFARQGAEVTLTSVFDRQDAGQQARSRARPGRRHRHHGRLAPVACDQGRRRPRHRAARGAARPRWSAALDIKKIEGTEKDIEADLIVSAIGQAVDFTGLEEFNNGKGAINADKNYQVQPASPASSRRRRDPSRTC
jgi:hypothetical protein